VIVNFQELRVGRGPSQVSVVSVASVCQGSAIGNNYKSGSGERRWGNLNRAGSERSRGSWLLAAGCS
jgi:hypothetical protein